jgi:large subunit ribosomal protein L25
MERISLEVQVRKEMGKGPSRRLRREGLIPGVLYGPHRQPLALALKPKDLRQVLASGENILVNLLIKEGEGVQTRIAMVKEYELDPLSNAPRHVDLYEISLEEAIRVEVPLQFIGEPMGVTMGGTLSPLLWSLEVSCLPERVPHEIQVDCTRLNIGELLYARDLAVPEGVKVLTDPSTAVVTVTGRASTEAVASQQPAEVAET